MGIFGFRLVPQDLYDLMLTALHARVVASPVQPTTGARDMTPTVSPAVHAVSGEVAPLPQEVVNACERYAYDDHEELSRNHRHALARHLAGAKPEVIVREIQRGANLDGLLV